MNDGDDDDNCNEGQNLLLLVPFFFPIRYVLSSPYQDECGWLRGGLSSSSSSFSIFFFIVVTSISPFSFPLERSHRLRFYCNCPLCVCA